MLKESGKLANAVTATGNGSNFGIETFDKATGVACNKVIEDRLPEIA